jgi:acyl dehydratase
MSTYYLEDFTPGTRITTPSFTLREDELLDFAHKYDPQPFHTDAEAAKGSVFGGLVAGGFQTAALAWRLALRTGCFEHSAMAGIGIDELRWLRPLRVDDTVSCTQVP